MTTIPGIDVSGIGQGPDFDWAGWRGRIDFAFAKATEGLTFRDSTWPRNRSMMHALGIVAGGYHYFHPELDAVKQAEWFLSYATPEAGELMMVDVEINGGLTSAKVSATVGAYVDKLHAETGAWPVAYTDKSLAISGALAGAAACPAFIANPDREALPAPIGPWRLVSFEQTGQRGVDSDVFFGDVTQLRRLGVPAARPVAAPAPVPVIELAGLDLSRGVPTSASSLPVIWLRSVDGGKTFTRS